MFIWLVALACWMPSVDAQKNGVPDSAADSGDALGLDSTSDTGRDTSLDSASDSAPDSSADTASDETGSGADCPSDGLATLGTWSYSRPASTTLPFDSSSDQRGVTATELGVDVAGSSSVHWDGSNMDYPYVGEDDRTMTAHLACLDGRIVMESLDFAIEGWGGAYGSAHAWGGYGTITLEPPVPVWREGATEGDTWSADTVASWEWSYSPDGDEEPMISSYAETWTWTVGETETLDTALGAMDAQPLSFSYSSDSEYGTPAWLFIFAPTTWVAAAGVPRYGEDDAWYEVQAP